MDDKTRARGRALFGDDPGQWPEPWRSEATGPEDADPLERLILTASLLPTDEAALSRQVLSRLSGQPSRRRGAAWLPGWSGPGYAVAGFAALLVLTPVTIAKFPVGPLSATEALLVGFSTGDPVLMLFGLPAEPRP